MQWGDFPTWVAAIGTVGAFVAAFIQIGTERRRRHAREEQDRAEAKIAQARLVSAILGPFEFVPDNNESDEAIRLTIGRTGVDLFNSSQEPVYTLVVGLVFIQGAAPSTIEAQLRLRERLQSESGKYRPVPITTVSVLPPGRYRTWVQGTAWGGVMGGRLGVEVAFTDRNGSHWIRRATGELEELPEPPLQYVHGYGMYGPHELNVPEAL